MSSNIEVQRICEHCGNEFTARTTTTRYCSTKCNSAAYKAKLRGKKVDKSNTETQKVKFQSIEDIKAKEFLTVKEVARLLSCSIRSVYYYIENGSINAVNLGQRITRVKRSEIDKLFEQTKQDNSEPEQIQYAISDCYTLTEVQQKYNISESAVQQIIKRNNIPKIKKGWYAYVPKTIIDSLLT